MKFKEFLGSEWGKAIVRALACIVVTAAIFIAIFFTGKSAARTLVRAADACFACFGICFGAGFFTLGNKYGAFTSFQYGFSYMFGSLGRYYRSKNGGTYGNFVRKKREKRSDVSFPYVPYFAISLIWLVIALTLTLSV
ncbi:MAG TPA: hypothetical protein DEA32_00055 [Firmicutes bacterium]|nr:hypothetical protein [Bacillota bacterium]